MYTLLNVKMSLAYFSDQLVAHKPILKLLEKVEKYSVTLKETKVEREVT